MRITFVLPDPNLSGGVRVVAIYADRLRRRGHTVTVVATPRPGPTWRATVGSLLRHRKLPRVKRHSTRHFDDLDVPVTLLDRPRPVTDRDVPDADVVVATWWETAGPVAALSPRKGAKAYFMQDYGAVGQRLDEVAPTWSLPMHLITISGYLERLIRERVDAPVTVVPNGVDMDRFHAAPRGKRPVATFGTLYNNLPEKGGDLILDAATRAIDGGVDLRLIGFGPAPPKVAHPLLTEPAFRWGPPNAEIPALYAACDAWLYGVRREGFGLPLLEAMACRTPVIATPAGAAPQLVADGGGVLVDHDDPAAMADAIVAFARMPEAQWRARSDAAYAMAQRHTWDAATERFEAALRRTIEQPLTESTGS